MADSSSRPQYNVRIREIPSSERPRERLRDLGAGSLSNAELLAIILRTGSGDLNVLNLATNLLVRHGGLGGLASLSFSELLREKGLGEAKVSELMAVFQIAARLQKLQPDEKVLVRTPLDVYLLLGLELAFLDQEHLRVILVNTRSQVIAITEVYVGNVSSALVRVSELFKEAVRQNAPAIILVHNHPSGDPTPSPDDVVLTKQAAAAGRLLNIEVMDHIIIGRDGSKYLSMQQMGLGGLSET
jgi:DNA repair protein RadC